MRMKLRWVMVLMVVAVGVGMGSCTKHTTNGMSLAPVDLNCGNIPGPPETDTLTIGHDGGVLRLDNAGHMVVILPGAIPQNAAATKFTLRQQVGPKVGVHLTPAFAFEVPVIFDVNVSTCPDDLLESRPWGLHRRQAANGPGNRIPSLRVDKRIFGQSRQNSFFIVAD